MNGPAKIIKNKKKIQNPKRQHGFDGCRWWLSLTSTQTSTVFMRDGGLMRNVRRSSGSFLMKRLHQMKEQQIFCDSLVLIDDLRTVTGFIFSNGRICSAVFTCSLGFEQLKFKDFALGLCLILNITDVSMMQMMSLFDAFFVTQVDGNANLCLSHHVLNVCTDSHSCSPEDESYCLGLPGHQGHVCKLTV